MTLNISTAITGVVINGFTTPGYTLTADSNPAPNMKQSVVSALTGTQNGVRVHSPSDPFSISVSKPIVAVGYPVAGINGVLGKAGRNKYTIMFRKGTIPLVGQAPQVSDLRIETNVVSGAEVNDKANLAAMYSAAAAWLNREAAGLLDTAVTGVTG